MDSCSCCSNSNCLLGVQEIEDITNGINCNLINYADKIKFCFPDINLNNEDEFKLCSNCSDLLKGACLLKQQLLNGHNFYVDFNTDQQIIVNNEECMVFKNESDIRTIDNLSAKEVVNTSESSDTAELPKVRTSKRLREKAKLITLVDPKVEQELVEVTEEYANFEDCNEHSYSKKKDQCIKFGCGYCGDTFKLKKHLIVHLQTHMSDSKHECDHCLETFFEERELHEHIQKVHETQVPFPSEETSDEIICGPKKKTRRYKCQYCLKEYVIRSACLAHERSHFEEPTVYECQYCLKQFKNSKNLKDHIRIHTGEKPYLCKLCGKSFRQQTHLNIHEQWHKGVRPYKCDHCPKAFRFYRGLMEHESKNPGPNRPFRCQYCDAGFSLERSLRRHELDHQKPEKPVLLYSCQYCQKTFRTVGSLNIHERLHTGEKPYQCAHCLKTFSDASYLRYHRLMHSNEKPYRCEMCDHSYRSNGALIVHRRTHTGEKPYQCQYCPMTFRSRPVQQKHEQKVHERKKIL